MLKQNIGRHIIIIIIIIIIKKSEFSQDYGRSVTATRWMGQPDILTEKFVYWKKSQELSKSSKNTGKKVAMH